MKSVLFAAGLVAALLIPAASHAQDRYAEPPPVFVSPDLSAPWVMQLRQAPNRAQVRHIQRQAVDRSAKPRRAVRRMEVRPAPHVPAHLRAAAVVPKAVQSRNDIHPRYLPQEVAYSGPHKPGTIVVDTVDRLLYLVLQGGKARRYGVGVGKPGFEWAGTHTVSQKREWPEWRPPAEMIAREKKKGRHLPTYVSGGQHNPLGARALYLGSTLYRIHGTNEPWTIGGAVSSGCIRMRNQDVIDLYERVPVGTKVVVI